MKKISLDVARVKKESEDEIRAEQINKAKGKVKDKLRALDNAKKVVANVERELADLYDELEQNA